MRVAVTMMAREAAEAAAVCAAQVERNAPLMEQAAARLRALDPPFAATLARGSSDQAAAFGKVLFETRAAMPTMSHQPSVATLYRATSPRLRGVPLIAISQSGRSPDLLQAAEDARAAGALLVVLVNDTGSPLAAMADILIPLHAGAETSVAATKSFVASLVALAQLTAAWGGDAALARALSGIGPALEAAWAQDWSAALAPLTPARSLLVLGRGLTLPIAGEAALKLKETSGLHAEAYSSAEVAHGPMTLVGEGDPVLVFAPTDVGAEGMRARTDDFAARGARVIAAAPPGVLGDAVRLLPLPAPVHPVIDAIGRIVGFYRLANDLAVARGRDPDRPPHLRKVTETR